MLFDAPCSDTVSILEAVLFGAGEACIDVGMTSLLVGVALFIGCVLVLRLIALIVLRRIFPKLRRQKPEPQTPPSEGLQKLPYESPIRSR
ncbi:MAG: hypothetical protein ABJF50_15030 [Paracoccaceae bacterium]